jgi:hypothetical protein
MSAAAADLAAVPPAFVFPGISSKFPPALLAAAAVMATQAEVVRKARDGAKALERRAAELKLQAASLEQEIERSDGTAAAAIAMGIEKADPNRKATVAAQTAELAAINREIAETSRALVAAPALFEHVREPLTEALSAFERGYAASEALLAEWAETTLSALNQATLQVKHFANGIKRCGAIAAQTCPSVVAPGQPLALFPQITEFNAAFNAAQAENRPLIAAADPAPARAEALLQRERVVSITGGRN